MKRILLLYYPCRHLYSERLRKRNRNPTTPALIVENPIIMDTPTSVIGCSVKFAEVEPTSAPGSALIPPVSAADFSLGPADALSDTCGILRVSITRLRGHGECCQGIVEESRTCVSFRPLPLIGILINLTKRSSRAGDEQGSFWAMYELLFTKYNEWAD